MRYKLQCIDDGALSEAIEMDSIEVIPPWGDLIVTISENVLDRDVEQICIELMRFFGEHRKIGIVRAGELKFTLVIPPDVSAEGASWAMEVVYCPCTKLKCYQGCVRGQCLGVENAHDH